MPANFQVWLPSGVIQLLFLLPRYSAQKPPSVVWMKVARMSPLPPAGRAMSGPMPNDSYTSTSGAGAVVGSGEGRTGAGAPPTAPPLRICSRAALTCTVPATAVSPDPPPHAASNAVTAASAVSAIECRFFIMMVPVGDRVQVTGVAALCISEACTRHARPAGLRRRRQEFAMTGASA